MGNENEDVDMVDRVLKVVEILWPCPEGSTPPADRVLAAAAICLITDLNLVLTDAEGRGVADLLGDLVEATGAERGEG